MDHQAIIIIILQDLQTIIKNRVRRTITKTQVKDLHPTARVLHRIKDRQTTKVLQQAITNKQVVVILTAIKDHRTINKILAAMHPTIKERLTTSRPVLLEIITSKHRALTIPTMNRLAHQTIMERQPTVRAPTNQILAIMLPIIRDHQTTKRRITIIKDLLQIKTPPTITKDQVHQAIITTHPTKDQVHQTIIKTHPTKDQVRQIITKTHPTKDLPITKDHPTVILLALTTKVPITTINSHLAIIKELQIINQRKITTNSLPAIILQTIRGHRTTHRQVTTTNNHPVVMPLTIIIKDRLQATIVRGQRHPTTIQTIKTIAKQHLQINRKINPTTTTPQQ